MSRLSAIPAIHRSYAERVERAEEIEEEKASDLGRFRRDQVMEVELGTAALSVEAAFKAMLRTDLDLCHTHDMAHTRVLVMQDQLKKIAEHLEACESSRWFEHRTNMEYTAAISVDTVCTVIREYFGVWLPKPTYTVEQLQNDVPIAHGEVALFKSRHFRAWLRDTGRSAIQERDLLQCMSGAGCIRRHYTLYPTDAKAPQQIVYWSLPVD